MDKGGVVTFFFLALICFFRVSESAASTAMFIFGDSLIDNGNNNYIPSIAKANYFPYGIDVGIPTGRFCNGLTVTDYGGMNQQTNKGFLTSAYFKLHLKFMLICLFVCRSQIFRARVSAAVFESFVGDCGDLARGELRFGCSRNPRRHGAELCNIYLVYEINICS